jgi:peptide/nickel transport system substrate-binding protein
MHDPDMKPRSTYLPRKLAALALFALYAQAATPVRAGQTDFLIDLPSDPASLDPQVQWDPDSMVVYRQIYDNLVTRAPDGQIVPQVATSWSYQSPTLITFKIRTDIKFQDGSALTPDDVVFSIKRITDPAFKSPQLSQFDQIVGAAVVGPDAIQLSTKTPYPVLLDQLTKLAIISQSYTQKVHDLGLNQMPMGSGPYRFVSRTQGVKIELMANPDYWGPKPNFPRVEMHPVPNEATRIADVQTGRADIARIISTDDAEQVRTGGQLKVLWAPTERATMLTLNLLDGPTKDLRVRQAIALAIDRNTIGEALMKGYTKPINEPLTPASFGYDAAIPAYEFDPDKARAILKAAGVAPGTKLSFLTSPAFDQRIVQALQQMLNDIGFDTQIVSVDLATYLRLRQGRPDEAGDVSYFRWSCSCQDADGTLYTLFHSSSQWSKMSDPQVDKLLDAARNTLDEKARLADYKAALEALYGIIPAVPLFQDPIMFVARKPVQFQPTANEAFFLSDVTWKP